MEALQIICWNENATPGFIVTWKTILDI